MSGVRFLVDEAGNKTSVVLDLRKHRRLWEDFYDRHLLTTRRQEPRTSLEEVRKELSRRDAKTRPKAHA